MTYDPTDTHAGGYAPAPADAFTDALRDLCAELAALVEQMQQANDQINAARRLYEDMTR